MGIRETWLSRDIENYVIDLQQENIEAIISDKISGEDGKGEWDISNLLAQWGLALLQEHPVQPIELCRHKVEAWIKAVLTSHADFKYYHAHTWSNRDD